MFTLNKPLALILLFLIKLAAFGQAPAEELVQGLRDKTNRIKSFEVKATIKVDVDFIDISDRQVSISYEAPGKFNFDGEGLILLPKNGVQMEYMSLLNNNYTAIDAGSEKIDDVQARIIKIIPESIESDIILAQLWIEPEMARLLRMKTFTKSSGSYMIEFTYSNEEDILPASLLVLFDINNMSVPVKMMNDFMNKKLTEEKNAPNEAKVTIIYSDYNITYKE